MDCTIVMTIDPSQLMITKNKIHLLAVEYSKHRNLLLGVGYVRWYCPEGKYDDNDDALSAQV